MNALQIITWVEFFWPWRSLFEVQIQAWHHRKTGDYDDTSKLCAGDNCNVKVGECDIETGEKIRAVVETKCAGEAAPVKGQFAASKEAEGIA